MIRKGPTTPSRMYVANVYSVQKRSIVANEVKKHLGVICSKRISVYPGKDGEESKEQRDHHLYFRTNNLLERSMVYVAGEMKFNEADKTKHCIEVDTGKYQQKGA